jgi:hypothetical protein
MTTVMLKYGQPDANYLAKHCFIWDINADFPWVENIINSGTGSALKRVYINRELRDKLFVAFTNLEKAGLHTEIKTFDGCYNPRQVRGRNSKSLHAWAMAVDFNADIEKLGQNTTNWSGRFLAVMKAAALYWGGDWKSRKDSMHFALYNG